METGPCFLDPHLEAKVKDATLVRYRRALRLFLEFTIDFKLSPDTPQQFDDRLVEWKDTRSVSNADFEGCIAAIELCCQILKALSSGAARSPPPWWRHCQATSSWTSAE